MEQVVMEVSATLEGAGGLGLGKLRVTTERLVFERKKMFGGAGDVTTFPLSSIQKAGISGVLEKKLRVRAGSTELVFTSGLSATGDAKLKAISDLLQRSIAGQPLGSPMQAPGSVGQASPPLAAVEPVAQLADGSTAWLADLERVAALHASGALTDDEFALAKNKLLQG